ncbi:MAG TPA: methyl-accepting chemotaxis protein [Thiobacillaceae bacterium]|nr:methyl-accepting chemotaxis protein [Thiobacillaceae bacterium]
MKFFGNSVQAKIVLAITLTFLAVLSVSVFLTARGERSLALDIANGKARDIARTYFDGVNTMMLTGTMDQKENLRGKLLATTGLRSVEIINAPGKIESLSKENPPRDDLDRRALQGAEAHTLGQDNEGRTVTVLSPIRASSNYLGTNCLGCHQVPEGSVVGAVRVTYSLAELDGEIQENLVFNSLANVVLYVLGIGLVLALLRKIVISPLLNMRRVMQQVEQDSDLGRRLQVHGNDEVGILAQTINDMLEKFRVSLTQVADTSERLSAASEKISHVSEETTEAANSQRTENDHAVADMDDLKALAAEVGGSARETAQTSVEADREAAQSTAMTREAIGGILALVNDIDQAAGAMEKLDERSHEVSGVLDVIRGIAEQTNLLALNAAIEAARAGEAGRGFAVVADEVRKLATLSHDSTRSIEDIVSQLQREAKDAVQVMGHARDSATQHGKHLEQAVGGLDQIVTRVGLIRELNTRMAQAVSRQCELTERVSSSIGKVSELADHTAEETGETSLICKDLARLAHELQGMVTRFRLS